MTSVVSASYIYVVGEVEEPTGPVKIGMHAGQQKNRSGLSAGNWRQLQTICRQDIPHSELRWREWLIHRRLQAHHVRGEWFDVRNLVVDGDWHGFLDDVFYGRLETLHRWRLGSDGHHLAQIVRIGGASDRRQFDAICSCGVLIEGLPGQALVTVQVRFAVEHLGLLTSDPEIRELRRQIHQMVKGDGAQKSLDRDSALRGPNR